MDITIFAFISQNAASLLLTNEVIYYIFIEPCDLVMQTCTNVWD